MAAMEVDEPSSPSSSKSTGHLGLGPTTPSKQNRSFSFQDLSSSLPSAGQSPFRSPVSPPATPPRTPNHGSGAFEFGRTATMEGSLSPPVVDKKAFNRDRKSAQALRHLKRPRPEDEAIEEIDARARAEEAVKPGPIFVWPWPMPPSAPEKRSIVFELMSWLQFIFNLFCALIVMVVVGSFLYAAWRDVSSRYDQKTLHAGIDVVACQKDFSANRCESPVPGVARLCDELRRCLNRDTSEVGRARVYAEVLAEVINSFVEPFSVWTIGVVSVMVAFGVVLPNLFFSFIRSRFAPSPAAPAQPHYHAPPPQAYAHQPGYALQPIPYSPSGGVRMLPMYPHAG